MNNSSIIIKIISGVLISLFLSFFYNYFTKKEFSEPLYTLLVSSHFSCPSNLQLYYDSGSGFNETETITEFVNFGQNTTEFKIKNSSILRAIRLDFEQKPELDSVLFNKISLVDNDKKEVLFIHQNKIKESIEIISSNIKFDDEKIVFTNSNNEDTYVIFKPIFKLKTNDNIRFFLFLFPLILMFSLDLFKAIKSKLSKDNLGNFFACLLILTFPLKESITTFVILIWTVFSLFTIIKTKRFIFRIENIVLGTFLIIPLIFGRSIVYENIHILLSLILVIIINSSSLFLDKQFLYQFYSLTFIILAISLIISWFSTVFIFEALNHLSAFEYFTNIKLNNHYIREWLPYTHATYYSFFIILGNYFAFRLKKHNEISKLFLLLISSITLIAILILGSRIALILFLILIISFFFKKIKLLIRYYLSAGFALTVILVLYIDKLDVIRSELWSVSYKAIAENPILGYGIGLSNKVLNADHVYITENSVLTYNHPHNQFIVFLLELGLVGTLLILGILLFFHIKKSSLFNLDYKVSVFLIYCLFLVESPLETSKSIIMIAFIIILTNLNSNFKNISLNNHIGNGKTEF